MNTEPRTVTRETIVAAFEARYGTPPALVVRAPGRVNLIGEHTDYNDGFVLPMAIDRAVWIALRPRRDDRVVAYSVDLDNEAQFSAGAPQKEPAGWQEYLKGVAWVLGQAGHALTGWEGVVSGDVPRGSGLSSSAALELATARAFAAVGNLPWNPATMARVGQRAENEWVGVNCGIMDQMVSAAAAAGSALLIDCRTLETKAVALPAGVAVVIMDTGTRRGLVDSAYNQRRARCEAAAAALGVPALRDVDAGQLAAAEPRLDPLTFRRARHVVTENQRVLAAVAAMQAGDGVELGRLMNASHASLRDDYEVSSPALDAMVDAALAHPACLGARMTGAGFGGAAVALVAAERVDDFIAATAAAYGAVTDHTPAFYAVTPTAGAALV